MSFKLWLSTSAPVASWAIESQQTWLVNESRDTHHSESVMRSLHATLHELNLSLTELTEFYVDLGPGSFTGVRFALSLAKAWGFSIPQLKIFPLSSFQAMNHLIPHELDLIDPQITYFFALHAYRQAIYICPAYRWNEKKLIYVDQLNAWLEKQKTKLMLLGNAIRAYHLEQWCKDHHITWQDGLPHVQGMRIYVTRSKLEPATDWRNLQAYYLRPSAAEEKTQAGG